MSVEGFSLIEHFDYMKRSIPQPFLIPSSEVNEIVRASDGLDCDYIIKTSKHDYSLSRNSLKKLVDSLGVKYKLLSAVCDETNVIELVLPIVNKLFKCYSDCFVFYASADEALVIIDLNVNSVKGEEGTRYEDGPSPWQIDINKNADEFTCFANFMDKYSLTENDTSVLVKSDSVFGTKVSMNLFKPISGSYFQPMLSFVGKFSNMGGFTEIHPALYDETTDIVVQFPMNYVGKDTQMTFSEMMSKLYHIHSTFDLNDFIFREMNELIASDDAPGSVKSVISNIIVNSTINMNQSIKDILTECNTVANSMKPAKARKFKAQVGNIIGWCVLMKHVGCSNCGHIHI